MLDQLSAETKTVAAAEYQPQPVGTVLAPLKCVGCGETVTLAVWQPIIRCPRCEQLVYPDRSLRNLLPLGWDCPECGASNDGLANFCLSCGAGLASRCLHCEAPVYGPICLRCGEHQAHLRSLQKRQAERAAWIPIQRERVREQLESQAEQKRLEQEAARPAPSHTESAPTTRREARREARRLQRPQRSPRRGRGWGMGWGWMLIAGGVVMFVRQFGSMTITPPEWFTQSATWLQSWWAAFAPGLNRLPALTPQDPEYAVVFASVLVGLAAFPLMLYFIDRMVKRFFP